MKRYANVTLPWGCCVTWMQFTYATFEWCFVTKGIKLYVECSVNNIDVPSYCLIVVFFFASMSQKHHQQALLAFKTGMITNSAFKTDEH